MKKKSKRYRQGAEKIKKGALYPLAEAIALIQELSSAKFDETVELAFNMGIDPKQTDQLVRGTVALPHGTGKKVRVAVFAKGAQADEAKAAGADIVGHEDLIKKVSEGWTDFDMAVTTPDLMRELGRLGKILGPRGLMPSPKTGTVTKEVGKAVKELKAGKIEFRTDRGANIQVPIGKKSFAATALVDNARVVIDGVLKARPSTVKGSYFKRCTVSSTMCAGVPVDMKEFAAA
jgi:large subunit ribosomal protein L1